MHAALAPEAALEPLHAAVVAGVVVAEQVQQAVQRKPPVLDVHRTAARAGLPPGHAPWR